MLELYQKMWRDFGVNDYHEKKKKNKMKIKIREIAESQREF